MTTDDEPSDWDVRVGRHVQELRRARDMTQAELASELSERGLSLRQQVIVKIEQGKRPLRLREADLIARALHVDVGDLVMDDPTAFDQTSVLIHQTERVGDGWRLFKENLIETMTLLDALRATLRRLAQSGNHEFINPSVLNDAATTAQLDLEAVVAAAVEEWKARGAVRHAQWQGGVPVKKFDADEWREAD